MNSIDTNVVVRVVTEDDSAQTAVAIAAVSAGVFVTAGVWIETEWVLRSGYRWSRIKVADGLSNFLDLNGVHVADRGALEWAIDRYTQGADWADMLHLINSSTCETFVTFDRALANQAGRDTPLPIETLT